MAPSNQNRISSLISLLVLTPPSLAQGFGGGYSGGNPYSTGGSSSNNPFSSSGGDNGDSGFNFFGFNFSHARVVLTAHAILATLAFALFFPLGGILIRLGSFRGVWAVHALVQGLGYALYIAAFGLGVWLITERRVLLHNAHPIIGITLFALLFFQPLLGFLHHAFFRKHSRRVVWSYAHIWLGRIMITLGIINGGLGLQLAKRLPLAPPSEGAVVAYGVVTGVIWLVYVMSILVGERRRRKRVDALPKYREVVGGKVEYA